jgi:acyl carrier protein
VTDIAAEVKRIIVFHLGVAEEQISNDARFKDLGADSLDVVEVVMTCEERFDLEIPTKVASTFVKVSDLVGCIGSRLAEPALPSKVAAVRRPRLSFG